MFENIYSFLLVKSEKYNLNEIFFLHVGDNTVGKDIDCDIVLQLEDEPINSLHAKIIVDENFFDLGIEDISISGSITKEINGNTHILTKRREYEFSSNRIYYLTPNVKLIKVDGNLQELIVFLNKYDLCYYYKELKEKYNEFINGKKYIIDNITNSNEDDNIYDQKIIEDFNNFD